MHLTEEPLKSPIMLSEGCATAIKQYRRTWQEPEAKNICEGVTLSLNPPLRFHPRPYKQLYINFKTIKQNE